MFRISGVLVGGGRVLSSGVMNIQNFWSSWGGGGGRVLSSVMNVQNFWSSWGGGGGPGCNTTEVNHHTPTPNPPPKNFFWKTIFFCIFLGVFDNYFFAAFFCVFRTWPGGGAGGTPLAVMQEECLVTNISDRQSMVLSFQESQQSKAAVHKLNRSCRWSKTKVGRIFFNPKGGNHAMFSNASKN